MVQRVPRPRARAASMKLHTAGSTDPNAEAWTTWSRPSVRPRVARHDVHGDLGEVVGQVARRAADAPLEPAALRVGGRGGAGAPQTPSVT